MRERSWRKGLGREGKGGGDTWGKGRGREGDGG